MALDEAGPGWIFLQVVYVFAVALALLLGLLLWRDHGRGSDGGAPAGRKVRRRGAVRKKTELREILVDGSNVMWWHDELPRLDTLIAVVTHLQRKGFRPGVIFDASAGHRLFGRYRDDAFVAAALGLSVEQVLVVPKGEVADRFLLGVARDRNLSIITNDRYREWLEDFPEAGAPGRLLRGGFRAGRLWLDEPEDLQDGRTKAGMKAGGPGRARR